VPELVVRRRFARSMRNFLLHYRELADGWTLFDNSGKVPQVMATEKNKRVRIIKQGVYTSLVSQYGRTCKSLQKKC
jgi:predicted ABC-type ATPase